MRRQIALLNFLRRVGNKVYDQAFPIYRVCSGAFKAYADRAERQLLKDILSNGSVVPDAGANIGIYSEFLPAASRRPASCIHSNLPRKTLGDCRLPRVTCQMCACASLQWESAVDAPSSTFRVS